MAYFHFISHPQVRVSADIPIPRWGLTDAGRGRVESVSTGRWLDSAARLISSDETKALETASILASETGLPIEVRASLGENDRSSTGYVPSADFELLADAFFAEPDTSVKGWETARTAQSRVIESTSDLLEASEGDVVVSGHGGVGTLLLCHLLGVPIGRDQDQSSAPAAPGGGNYWTYDLDARRVIDGWKPIEELVARD